MEVKMETQNIMASSYPLKVSSAQNKGVPQAGPTI